MVKVDLIQHGYLSSISYAARTCYGSHHKGGSYDRATDKITDDDKALIAKLIHKYRHESVSEHLTYTFDIQGLTRSVLQELARHRIASYSVRSSRYTLKELKAEKPFCRSTVTEKGSIETIFDVGRASKYIRLSDDKFSANNQVRQLEGLREAVCSSTQDKAKLLLPESYLTNVVWTINVRSLRNFLRLRLSKGAYYLIRELAEAVYKAIPNTHKFLFEDIINEQHTTD